MVNQALSLSYPQILAFTRKNVGTWPARKSLARPVWVPNKEMWGAASQRSLLCARSRDRAVCIQSGLESYVRVGENW